MMALRKARKDSSVLGKLRGKTAAELKDILAQPSELVQYVNKYVEERAGVAEELLLKTTLRVRRRLLSELANTKPEEGAIRRFQKQWKSTLRAESVADLVELGDKLRFIWDRPAIDVAEQILNKWLVERPGAATGKGQRTRGAKPAGTVTASIPFCVFPGSGPAGA